MTEKNPQLLVPRRRPAQARSRVRFERILKAARDVLVDLGFESFTFDEVSKRAEVPIGTLYQFFANKYVLICELDREDTAANVEELNKFSQRVPALQWPDLLDEFIDHLRSEEHTSELQLRGHLVCRLLLEKKNTRNAS